MTDATTSSNTRFIAWMTVAMLVVLADQLTKWAIIQGIDHHGVPYPVNSFMQLVHLQNEGAAWSFLADAGGWQRWFFITLSSVVSVVLVVWIWRIRDENLTVLAAGLALVLGGAVGNLIDRVLLGHVTDFIQVRFSGVPFFDPFPAFNIADAGISVGAALLIIDAFFFSGRMAEKS